MKMRVVIVVTLMLLVSRIAFAEPKGGTVIGNGSINQAGGVTVVRQWSDKVIINWRSFGIGLNELVKFIQPSKLAIALEISARVYVLGHGRVVFEGTPAELRAAHAVRKEWLEV